ncbi:MAG: response regulator [Gammaproteobacteria bacterium]|nr:response regulator [Gammaproteobacteria bacterium]MDH3448266.1 response regulator [Gammaproteobacteria bacterium]
MSADALSETLVLLLVEDNDAHAEMVKRSFEQHKVPNVIFHVDDGQKALDYVFRSGEYADADRYPSPHCILLDLRLPKVDGLEVLRRIKNDANTRKTPVVILTTSSADKDIARSYEYHANSYIVKPMDFTRFESLMEDLGYYWLAWNQNPWR